MEGIHYNSESEEELQMESPPHGTHSHPTVVQTTAGHFPEASGALPAQTVVSPPPTMLPNLSNPVYRIGSQSNTAMPQNSNFPMYHGTVPTSYPGLNLGMSGGPIAASFAAANLMLPQSQLAQYASIPSFPPPLVTPTGVPASSIPGLTYPVGPTPFAMPMIGGNEWWMEQQRRAALDEQLWREARLGELRNRLNFEEALYATPGMELRGPAPTRTNPQVHATRRGAQNTDAALTRTPRTEEETDINRPYKPAALLAQSKFSLRISQADITRKLKMPSTVGKYDGTTDPDDHVNVFVSAGGVERWAQHEWCHMFAQTLVGPARLWYDSLPTGRINSFDEFLENFMLHF